MKNRIRVFTVVLMLSLLVGSFGFGCSGMSGSGDLKILSHSMSVRDFISGGPQSTAVVVGRAQNVSDGVISSAMIAVNFYDKNKNLLATGSAARPNLQPGETWDFTVQTVGPDAWKIVSYDIAASTK